MANTLPVICGRGSDRGLRLAFVSSMVSLISAFAAVGSTIPLFNLYRAQDGFTNTDISMAIVSYSAATLVTLLVMGRVSSHLGRRPTSIAGMPSIGPRLVRHVSRVCSLTCVETA